MDNLTNKDNRTLWSSSKATIVLIASILLFLSITYVSVLNRNVDPDCYFILANGRDIFEGGIPQKNIHSIIPGLNVVIQQWLYSAVMYIMYLCGGMVAVKLLAYIGYVLLAGVTALYISKRGVRKEYAFLAAVIMMVPTMYVFTSRPAVFTFILLILQCIILEDAKRKQQKGLLFILPVLMLVEINIHASMWIMHFIFLLPYLMPGTGPFRIIKKYTKEEQLTPSYKWLLLPAVLMCACLFINPYGVKGITYLFDSYNKLLNNGYITELDPPQIKSLAGIVILIVCMAAAAALYKRILSYHTVYFVLGSVLMAAMQYKNIPMITCAGMFLAADYMENGSDQTNHIGILAIINRILLAAGILSGWFMCLLVIVNTQQQTKDYIMAPQAAVKYLDGRGISKDTCLYTGLNSGAYMLWNGYKIYMEARPELYFKAINGKEDYYKEYSDVLYASETSVIEKFLIRYDFEYLIEDNGTPLDIYLQISDEYEEVVEGNGYRLYKHLGKEE